MDILYHVPAVAHLDLEFGRSRLDLTQRETLGRHRASERPGDYRLYIRQRVLTLE
jgi:hypothetical protein